MKSLHAFIRKKIPVGQWEGHSVQQFKRYSGKLECNAGVVWFRNKSNSVVPVVPYQLLIEIALTTHWEVSHMGRNKLLYTLHENIWHPAINEVTEAVCFSCSRCQLYKVSSQHQVPPTCKIETSQPFELLAADLVNLPRTSSGYIGCFVMVDHFSKWLTCVPIRDKRTSTISSILENRILPSLPAKPQRLLTDNGPEFR
jgi:hypothetical protein